MTEAELVNLLRTNTHMGRLAAGEVRETLKYMASIGLLVPEGSRLNLSPAAPSGYVAAPPEAAIAEQASRCGIPAQTAIGRIGTAIVITDAEKPLG